MNNYSEFFKQFYDDHDSRIMKTDKQDYDGVVVLPPPNITGKLHIGHALNAFVQDFSYEI